MGAATSAVVSLGSTALSAGAQYYGAQQEAKAQRKLNGYQRKTAKKNQARANAAATDAERRGAADALRAERSARQLQSRQRAVLAANGVEVDSGSAADIVSDTIRIGKADSLTIRDNARREADEYRAQGENFESEAYLAGKRKKNSSTAVGNLGIALTGVGQVASKWYSMDDAGVFG